MSSHPKISVVTLTYNRRNDLKRCLDSLMRQTYKDFEVVVVDGGSKDGTVELLRGYPVKLVVQQKKGVVPAYNLGWQHSSGDYVAYLDDDGVADEEWLSNVVGTFERSPLVGGVTGSAIIPEASRKNRDLVAFIEGRKGSQLAHMVLRIYKVVVLENRYIEVNRLLRSGAFTLGTTMPQASQLEGEFEVDFLSGCNMSYRRSLLVAVGGFDEEYSGVRAECSEPDLHLKIRRLGYHLIFNPRAKVWHSPGPISVKSHARSGEMAKNFVYFYFSNFRPLNLDKFLRLCVNLLYQNLYWLYNFSLTGNRGYLGGVWGFLAILVGLVSPDRSKLGVRLRQFLCRL